MSSNQYFFIEGAQLHKLDQTTESKHCIISIGNKRFKYSLTQIALLSLNAFDHFIESVEPFIIENRSSFSNNQLISAFKSIDSLFHSTTEITLNLQNVSIYFYLAEVLDNISLFIKCYKVTSDQPQVFKFTSHNLIYLSQRQKRFLNDVTLKVNENSFSINSYLFSCLSDSYQNHSIIHSQTKISLSEKDFSCFCSFIQIFNGLKFPIHQFIDCLQSLVYIFGFSCLISLIPIPQTVPEAINFLSIPSCEQFETHFLQSVSILINNFDSLRVEQLDCLCNSALLQIFLSNQLQIDNEDYLFDLIKQLIDKDSKKISLLKTLRFDYLSSNLVLDYFNQFPIDELDSDLFLILINQMFSRTIQQSQQTRQYRNQTQIPF
jgi:hypothetical protein